MKCPLFVMGCLAGHEPEPFHKNMECEQEKCAWWVKAGGPGLKQLREVEEQGKEVSHCAILAIAEGFDGLVNGLDEIASHLADIS